MRMINGLPEKEWRRQWYRKYLAANHEKILKRQRAYYARHKEHLQEVRRLYVERNKEKVKAEFQKWYEKNHARVAVMQRERVARKRGLSLLDIENMLAKQGGGCAICATTTPRGKGTWIIDHDHKTGAVRGLLCTTCNLALGQMGDDPDRLRKAAKYLEASK
jgi:hypothetical protein